jgi:hypothetical protein
MCLPSLYFGNRENFEGGNRPNKEQIERDSLKSGGAAPGKSVENWYPRQDYQAAQR